MRFFLTLLSCLAMRAEAAQLKLGVGPSVPADPTGETYVLPSGPSRASGGEHINIKFNGPKLISEVRLTSFSSGHAGKSLIHSAKGLTGATTVSLDGLFQFSKVTMGNPVNYQSLVMLPDTAWVAIAPNQPFSQLDIVIEGFTNNDASILVQVTSNDSLTVSEFLVTRTGSVNETAGGMIDESRYARFTGNELSKLMAIATQPSVSELAGKTFVCSVYTKLDAARVDVKRRSYSLNSAGALVSNSDLQGQNIPWWTGADGLQMAVDNFTGCGRFTTANVVRRTASGNLISETVLDLQKWIDQCVAQGFDAEGTKTVEENSTFPSVLAPKYRVDSFEFCKTSSN